MKNLLKIFSTLLLISIILGCILWFSICVFLFLFTSEMVSISSKAVSWIGVFLAFIITCWGIGQSGIQIIQVWKKTV